MQVWFTTTQLHATSGGVILADSHCFLTFIGSLVYNNSALQWLGGVVAILLNSEGVHSEVISLIKIYDSMFDSNFANYTGGLFNMTILIT